MSQVMRELGPVVRSAEVGAGPERAFDVFTQEMGAWWPLPTHSVHGERAGGVLIRDGRVSEFSISGQESVWGEVRSWEPPGRLVLGWHPGRAGDPSTEVLVSFESVGDGSRVTIDHRGWDGLGGGAADRRRAYVGPDAWGAMLDRFAALVESTEAQARPAERLSPGAQSPADIQSDPDIPSNPADRSTPLEKSSPLEKSEPGARSGPDSGALAARQQDLEALAAAYCAFYDEAEREGFGPAPEGEWSADEVIAHIALNDLSLIAVSQVLRHGRAARYQNRDCQARAALSAWIDRFPDPTERIEVGRTLARQVVDILGSLDAEQLDTEVPCLLLHDGEVVLDGPRPWGGLALRTQAQVHLPAHVEQLAKLRR